MLNNATWSKAGIADVPDLTKPSKIGLAYILRHEELWPKEFQWDFSYINSCAIELSARRWGTSTSLGGLRKSFNMSWIRTAWTFGFPDLFKPTTPEVIARRLEL